MDFLRLPVEVQNQILQTMMLLGERRDETAVRTVFKFARASKACWRLVEKMPGKRWNKTLLHDHGGTYLYWGERRAPLQLSTCRLLFGDSTVNRLLLFKAGMLPTVRADSILIEYPVDDMLQVLKQHKPRDASYSVAEIWDLPPNANLIQFMNDELKDSQLVLRRLTAPLGNYLKLKHTWIDVRVDDRIDGEENLEAAQNQLIEEWLDGERECGQFCLQTVMEHRGSTYIVTGYESEDDAPPLHDDEKGVTREDGLFIRITYLRPY
ncbi:unnamed protein product, partial [Mesorhabditis spiculigera]